MRLYSLSKHRFKGLIRKFVPSTVRDKIQNSVPIKFEVHHAGPDTWTAQHLPKFFVDAPEFSETFAHIDQQTRKTAKMGAHPLWEGYEGLKDYPAATTASSRDAQQVSTKQKTGRFFSWLVSSLKPKEIVEIGGAYGVSGMYWCAGLKANGTGNFTSFEPNEVWGKIAEANIQSVLERGRLILGPFEENQDKAPSEIDLAFIDAIHTPEFVEPQLNLVLERANPGAMIVLDDIEFSKPMLDYWKGLRKDPRFAAAFELTSRVGVLELAKHH